jgi:hypothetical protein
MIRLLQVMGAITLLAYLLPPRLAVLRPHARRIGMIALILYLTVGLAIVVIRIVAGPEPFMD